MLETKYDNKKFNLQDLKIIKTVTKEFIKTLCLKIKDLSRFTFKIIKYNMMKENQRRGEYSIH